MALEDLTGDLDALLASHGFVAAYGQEPKHSGSYETATWTRDDRAVALSLKYDVSIGYRMGDLSIDHGAYMRALLGPAGAHRFPTFAHDAEAAIAAIVHDLRAYGQDVLSGDGSEFRRLARELRSDPPPRGLARLTAVERELRDR